MKKLIVFLLMVALGNTVLSQQIAAPVPVRFQIHKNKCELRHERNGMRHDFRKFMRYQHFKHKMRQHRRHRMIKRAIR